MTSSLFADRHAEIYDRHDTSLLVVRLVGGIPSDPKVAEAWIKKHLGQDNDDLIREMVAKTMLERGVEMDDAVDEVVATAKLNGFKRDADGLYIEGRQVKAAIKEAANVSWPKRSWGPTRKGTKSFWAEHIFIPQDRIPLGVEQPHGIQQRFVKTWRGTGIQYEEYVDDTKLSFTVECDQPDAITDDDWVDLWVRAECLGLGATRSQGFGRFVVTQWTPVS